MMKQAPLDMGDIFIVDDGEFGITVKAKEKRTIQEVQDAWSEEEKKKFAYEDYETVTFLNEVGTEQLMEWLEKRKEKV